MSPPAQHVGAYEIILLRDGVFEAPTQVLTHADGAGALESIIGGRSSGFAIDVNCFLLRGPDGISMVDSGLGPAWGEAFGKARGALDELHMRPEHIDRVLLTHVHSDHALGLLEGAEPWLPRAEILVPAVDWEFFTSPTERAAQPEQRREPFDIAARLAHAYAGRLRPIPPGPVHSARGPMPGLEIMPLPGHTPGHSGYLFRGAQGGLLLWADALHLQDVQTNDPRVGVIFDVDPEQARQTRAALLEQVAREEWLVAGGHVSGFGHVRRSATAYVFAPITD